MLHLSHHLRDLRQEGGRVWITILGVVWGTMALTILVAFGGSISHTVIRAEQGMGKGIVVLRNGSTSIPYQGLPAARRIRLTATDVDALKAAVPTITAISAEYSRGAELSYAGKVQRASLSAVQPPYDQLRNCLPQPGGRFINDLDIRQRRRVAFLGDQLKQDLFGDDEAVGKTILLRGTPFTIVGVMRTKLQWSSYQSHDKSRIFIPVSNDQRTIQTLLYLFIRMEVRVIPISRRPS